MEFKSRGNFGFYFDINVSLPQLLFLPLLILTPVIYGSETHWWEWNLQERRQESGSIMSLFWWCITLLEKPLSCYSWQYGFTGLLHLLGPSTGSELAHCFLRWAELARSATKNGSKDKIKLCMLIKARKGWGKKLKENGEWRETEREQREKEPHCPTRAALWFLQ